MRVRAEHVLDVTKGRLIYAFRACIELTILSEAEDHQSCQEITVLVFERRLAVGRPIAERATTDGE